MGLLDNLFKKGKVKEQESTEAYTPVENKDEITAVIAAAAMDEGEEIVAAIIAAISVMLKKGTNEFIVRNIKRTPEMDSIWAHEGRMKLMKMRR